VKHLLLKELHLMHQITNHLPVLLNNLLFHIQLMSRLLGLHGPGYAMSLPKVTLG
jgi:hypothetical protein